jgi:hypothetical protein
MAGKYATAAPPRGARPPPAESLAFITFARPDRPHDVIYLSAARVAAVMDAQHFAGMRMSLMPDRIREPLFGRALGRVAAHEIGHYLVPQARRGAEVGDRRLRQRVEIAVADADGLAVRSRVERGYPPRPVASAFRRKPPDAIRWRRRTRSVYYGRRRTT